MGISNLATGLRPGVCTSTTRPSSPFEGQMIYETDTDKVLVWNGSAWYPNWNTAWGTVAFNSTTSSDTTISSEEVQITGSSFTAVANRYYRVTYYEPELKFNSSGGYFVARIRSSSVSGTARNAAVISVDGTVVYDNCTLSWVGTLSAGTANFVGTLATNTSTGSANRSSTSLAYLLVEDIGPA